MPIEGMKPTPMPRFRQLVKCTSCGIVIDFDKRVNRRRFLHWEVGLLGAIVFGKTGWHKCDKHTQAIIEAHNTKESA